MVAPTAIQRRGGSTSSHASFTGLNREVTVDDTKHTLVVHDGQTPGGFPLAKASDVMGKADVASPTFTGTPAAPTASPGTNTTQLATTAFVKAATDLLVASAPGALDTLNELAASLGNDASFATTVTNALAQKAPLASPTFTGAPAAPTPSVSDDSTKVATTAFVQDVVAASVAGPRRNRLVNPAMQISQENGNTSGTTNNYYPADQWLVSRVTSAGTITAQRVQSTTPKGSKDRLRVTITAADASLAAGEYLTVTQNIEGQEVADLRFGNAAAKQVVVRFGFKGPAGTYAVAMGNAAANRSYVALFTVGLGEANTDTEQTVVIPGDTTGSWLTDTGIGLSLNITLASGSTFQTTANAWQAGNYFGTSGVSNGMGTISSVFEIFDVGLYADPNSTGTAPTWEIPERAHELLRCQRYYENSNADGGQPDYNNDGYAVTSVGSFGSYQFKATKRTQPTISATFQSGTGAAFSPTGRGSFYQSSAHSGPSLFHWSAPARF